MLIIIKNVQNHHVDNIIQYADKGGEVYKSRHYLHSFSYTENSLCTLDRRCCQKNHAKNLKINILVSFL